MNGRQLSDRIGNIDDRLIQQAEQLPERKKTRLSDRAKHWIAAAAMVALMSASFSVGALAFSNETVVEVPVEQETLELTDIGITLILPDDWKGRYGVEQTGRNNSYHVYSTAVRDAFSRESVQQGGLDNAGGMLFYILKWDQQLTEEEWDDPFGEWNYARNRYIMATKDGTYLLYYASDVQFTPETEAEYRQMEEEIATIRFVVDCALWDPSASYHGENHELLAADIQLDKEYIAMIREAASALSAGEGEPTPAPESNYFSVSEEESVLLLYQMDGKSYIWSDGEALALEKPLFDELYQDISEQEYEQGESVKWLLREDNGKLMLISRYLSNDSQEPRRWYEENFLISEREQQRYVYMGENALVSLVDDGEQGQQGLALLLPDTMVPGEHRLYACCLVAYFSVDRDELSVSSIKAQLVTCTKDGPYALTDMISSSLEFDKAVGEQDLAVRAPEIRDYSFSEAEARRLVEDLLAQVFSE